MNGRRMARPPRPHPRPVPRARAAAARRAAPAKGLSDDAFRWAMAASAGAVVLMALLVAKELAEGSWPAWERFGAGFVAGEAWDVRRQAHGILPFITGTLLTSAMAMLLAVPVSLGIAILLNEYAPPWLGAPLGALVELLAAIPSVVFGLWGVVNLAPFMRDVVNPALEASPLGALPLFGEPGAGRSMLTASVVLAVMVIPIVASLSREVLRAVPESQREAAVALGLTKWEATRDVVLGYGRAGILGAAILGLGRALGETMAVTMLVGNSIRATLDYFEPASTMASIIAAQFGEARVGSLHLSSLIGVGLALFALSLAVNVAARLLVRRLQHGGAAA